MDDFTHIIDFYKNLDRLGPGGEAETLRAWNIIKPATDAPTAIADIGCGTGAQTEILARQAGAAQIIAVDFIVEFLESARARFAKAGLSVQTLNANMDSLPFAAESLDIIWSEGAAYNMGFEKAALYWNRFLKPGGFIALTELSWLSDISPEALPERLRSYWQNNYPDIETISGNIARLERGGYEIVSHFSLPGHCWTENYYQPVQAEFAPFLARRNYSAEAEALVAETREEIALYNAYGDIYGYEFYVARKVAHIIY
ncbi:MAG: methyltransferase domain-containing protein [Tannerellaceae bacterium]|jgi:ubiquinone/menaquinone biosynthesis C-methylase UbiE|nr:methyltransferase domain-containing protein [Tannerellaceae bacterium]